MTSESGNPSSHESIQRLTRPGRVDELDPFVVLSFCPISPNDVVGDIGCGPGYFTVPLAKQLANGKVFALDINDDMLDACRDAVGKVRMGNVEIMKCEEFDFPLEEASLDGAFVAFVIHHSPDKTRLFSQIRRLLKPRGWCSVLEWHYKETESGPPLGRRIQPAELQQMAVDAGFRYQGARDLNPDHYMVQLRNT